GRVGHEFYIEGRSYQGIQQRTGLARSSIAGYLYRARHRLADRLRGALSGVPWLPGVGSWMQHVIAAGSQAEHLPKAAVTAATVATVAVAAIVIPARPVPTPLRPERRTVGQAAATLPSLAAVVDPLDSAVLKRE